MSIAEIITQLEEANGPNYALEVEIFKLVHPEYACYIQGRGGLIHPQDGEDVRVQSNVRSPNYTASVDASLHLLKKVLPGWYVENLCQWEATVLRERGEWMCDLVAPQKPGEGRVHSKCPHAPSPAIALCIAILKAKQAQEVTA
jgi:hypothetical protein